MKKQRGIDPDLDRCITQLMNEVLAPKSKATLQEKLQVIDRGLQREKIRQKIDDEEWGSSFFTEEEQQNAGSEKAWTP